MIPVRHQNKAAASGIGILLADPSHGADDFVRAVRVAAGYCLMAEFIEFGDPATQSRRDIGFRIKESARNGLVIGRASSELEHANKTFDDALDPDQLSRTFAQNQPDSGLRRKQ